VIKTVEIIFEIINRSPDPVSAHRPDCPPALAELVHDLLAKDPDERPPEARGVVAALEAMLS
jgi:serine/threonine-protein kinase